jgi:NitT/TauT family transport system substrate-binding protein
MRRRILTATLCALALTALAAGGARAELRKLTVVLGYIPNVEMYGPEYALHAGLFQQAGLDVTLVPAGAGVDGVQMVSAGLAQIGIANPEQLFAAAAQGQKFIVFASQFQVQPIAMTCRKDAGVTTPADLPGKNIGVKVGAKPYFDLFLSKNHVDPKSVSTTAIGSNDISVLISGRIACEITTFAFNEPRLIEQAGVPVTILPLGSYGLNSQADSYFVTKAFFDAPGNQAMLVAFLRTQGKAWGTFFDDPKAAAKYMVDNAFVDGLDIDQQTYQAAAQATFMKSKLTAEKGILWINPDTFRETAENVHAAGIAPTVIDPAPMLSTAILEQAGMPKY